MKRLFITPFMFLYCTLLFAQDCFRLPPEKSRTAEKIYMEKVFEKDIVIYPFKNVMLSGISITGHINILKDDFLVRVIVTDKAGNEYLLLETYDEIYNDSLVSLYDYGEETLFLNNVTPSSMKVVVRNAVLELTNIQCVPFKQNTNIKENQILQQQKEKQLKEQKKSKIERINNYNNKHGKLWIAGETSLSSASYADMKRILGMNDACSIRGLEYYSGGLFEIGSFNNNNPINMRTTSNYVDSFDWTNRHGKQWTTIVKNQKNSKYCAAFATAATTESMTYLYYNQIFPLDLSEQEIACCSPNSGNPWNGIHPDSALVYLREHGVCQEDDYRFVNQSGEPCRSDEINALDTIKITNYLSESRVTFDTIKWAVINKGPLVSWVYVHDTDTLNHCMELVGYGLVTEGMTVNDFLDGNYNSTPVIIGGNGLGANDPRIGMTYWKFKNSWGPNKANGGYMYVLFDLPKRMYKNYSITYPILLSTSLARDIVCEDADGDGYYFWGIGPKPLNCPSWVPDEPDGDDSDINFGPMNEYGHLQQMPCGSTIKNATSYTGNHTLSCRLGIVNGGILTISGTTTMSGNGKIRVSEGGTLIVDGGTIQNADLTLVPGCTVILRNGGVINMASGNIFKAPVGAILNMESGDIY